jgi:hypothetical protein
MGLWTATPTKSHSGGALVTPKVQRTGLEVGAVTGMVRCAGHPHRLPEGASQEWWLDRVTEVGNYRGKPFIMAVESGDHIYLPGPSGQTDGRVKTHALLMKPPTGRIVRAKDLWADYAHDGRPRFPKHDAILSMVQEYVEWA